ncbi:MAG: phospholipid carrier-dependent glycosyltransferase [Proteobacteria bacterium]|nr:phospholipid carrier-dependent glycosyltransferase [Pseudomonadota bacterium]
MKRRASLLAAAVVAAVVIAYRDRAFAGFLWRSGLALGSGISDVAWRWDLFPLALAAGLALGMTGVGRWILAPARVEGALAAPFALGLGFGACGLALLLIGSLVGLSAAALAAVGGVLAAGAAMELRRWMDASPLRWPARGPSLAAGALAGVLAAAAMHAVVSGLAPPTEWDCLAYHAALPKLYWAEGAVREIPWMMHGHWPHLAELVYVLPIAVGADGAAALLHAALCAALAAAVLLGASRHLDPRTAWLAAALLACQPLMLRFAGTPHSDGALALYHVLCCLALWEWRNRGEDRLLVLAGVLAGFGASAKLHGAGLAAIWTAWAAWRAPSARRVRPAAIFGGAAFAVAAPWYAKAWLGAGDPVWPFLSGVLDDRHGGAHVLDSMRRFNASQWRMLPDMIRAYGAEHLLLPAAAFAAAALARRRTWPEFLKFMLVPVAPYALMVSGKREAWRFLWPVLPAVALCAAWAAAREIEDARGRRSRLRLAFATAALLFGMLPLAQTTEGNALFPVLGVRPRGEPDVSPREAYLDRALDHYRFYRSVNQKLSGRPDARVLLFRETRGYYLDARYIWGDPGNQGVILYKELSRPEDLRARLSELGVTHVLVNSGLAIYRPGHGDYDAHVMSLMDGVLSRFARPVLSGNGLALLELSKD